MSFYASNAIFAKTRSMYARRLKKDDFEKLHSCINVTQIAHFLKTNTVYSESFKQIDPDVIHRGSLEIILKQSVFKDLEILSRYDVAVGEHFVNYMIAKTEIFNILRFLVFLKSGNPSNYKFWIPDFFLNHTKINFKNFQNIKNFSEFLNELSGSSYHKIIKKLSYSENEEINLNEIETLIYSYYFEKVIEIAYLDLPKVTASKIKKFYIEYLDAVNLVRIIRLKKYYNKDSFYIFSLMFKFKEYNIKKLESLILAKDINEIFKKIKDRYPDYKFDSINSVDQLPGFIKFKWAIHNILFSSLSPILLLSYIFLKEIEIKNIINITEGKRYNLNRTEIENMLIN